MMNYSKNIVGCRLGGDIFIHPSLYKYPKLYQAVVKHEKQHTDSWGVNDVKLDFFGQGLKDVKWDFYKFILLHPRTLLGFCPITKIGKYWGVDLQMALVWVLIFVVGYLVGANL